MEGGRTKPRRLHRPFRRSRHELLEQKRQLNVAKNTFPDHPQIAVDPEGRIVVVWEEQAPVKCVCW